MCFQISNQVVYFLFKNSTCRFCNGYYGPSFGEPVCVTCHAFLFPNFPSFCPNSYYYSEKTDDGDSGNDEPSDLNFSSDRRVNRVCMVPSWWYIVSKYCTNGRHFQYYILHLLFCCILTKYVLNNFSLYRIL